MPRMFKPPSIKMPPIKVPSVKMPSGRIPAAKVPTTPSRSRTPTAPPSSDKIDPYAITPTQWKKPGWHVLQRILAGRMTKGTIYDKKPEQQKEVITWKNPIASNVAPIELDVPTLDSPSHVSLAQEPPPYAERAPSSAPRSGGIVKQLVKAVAGVGAVILLFAYWSSSGTDIMTQPAPTKETSPVPVAPLPEPARPAAPVAPPVADDTRNRLLPAPTAPPPGPRHPLQPPRVVSRVIPRYPPIARSARIEGIVTLSVNVRSDGTVDSLTAIDGPKVLIDAAESAVRQWRFTTDESAGGGLRTTTVNVKFDLDGQ